MKVAVAGLVFCFVAAGPPLPEGHAQSVAITLDDGPRIAEGPLLSPEARNAALLAHLSARKVRAALFVTGRYGAETPRGSALLKAWGQAGHLIGNHTMTHPDFNDARVSLAAYQAELAGCDALIRTVPGFRPFFRFTFLREGNTPEKQQGMPAFLEKKGYRNGYVTLDTSDWRLNAELEKVLRANPKADLSAIRRVYLSHVRQRAEAYRDLARTLLGRDIPQVMLLHHNLLNALFLGDVLDELAATGWRIVDPEVAYEDAVYKTPPERLTPGQSLLLSLWRARHGKVQTLPGWERLVDDGDAEVAELARGR